MKNISFYAYLKEALSGKSGVGKIEFITKPKPLKDAPYDTPLIIISEDLSEDSNNTSKLIKLIQGSILIKLSEESLYVLPCPELDSLCSDNFIPVYLEAINSIESLEFGDRFCNISKDAVGLVVPLKHIKINKGLLPNPVKYVSPEVGKFNIFSLFASDVRFTSCLRSDDITYLVKWEDESVVMRAEVFDKGLGKSKEAFATVIEVENLDDANITLKELENFYISNIERDEIVFHNTTELDSFCSNYKNVSRGYINFLYTLLPNELLNRGAIGPTATAAVLLSIIGKNKFTNLFSLYLEKQLGKEEVLKALNTSVDSRDEFVRSIKNSNIFGSGE